MLEGHKRDIHFIFSFGSNLISVDEDSTVRIWIIETTGTCSFYSGLFYQITLCKYQSTESLMTCTSRYLNRLK